MPLTIEVEEDHAVDQWGEIVERGVARAMPAVAEALREEADRCFETETDPWGQPWRPLEPATIRERARAGRTGKILQRDGILRGSIAATSDPTSATVAPGGAAAVYAAVHQFGDEHVPARPYLPIRANDAVELPEHVSNEITETVRDAVLAEIRASDPSSAR